MIGRVHLASGGAVFFKQRHGFGIAALVAEKGGEIVHGDERVGMGDAVDAALNGKAAAVEGFFFNKPAFLVIGGGQ